MALYGLDTKRTPVAKPAAAAAATLTAKLKKWAKSTPASATSTASKLYPGDSK